MLALFMTFVLCMSLCACREKNDSDSISDEVDSSIGAIQSIDTKDDLLAKAEKLDFSILAEDAYNNIVNAQTKYENKTVLVYGYVKKITAEEVVLKPYRPQNESTISVKLSQEDISKLSTDQCVDIVGVIESLESVSPGTGVKVNLKTAYFVNDTYTVSGRFVFGYKTPNTAAGVYDTQGVVGEAQYWHVMLLDADDGRYYFLHELFPVTHKSGQRITQLYANGIVLTRDCHITITAKVKRSVHGYDMYELISIEKQ